MTYHQYRKYLRTLLQAQRCADKDHSKDRYKADAKLLDDKMKAIGFTVPHKTTWGMEIVEYYRG